MRAPETRRCRECGEAFTARHPAEADRQMAAHRQWSCVNKVILSDGSRR